MRSWSNEPALLLASRQPYVNALWIKRNENCLNTQQPLSENYFSTESHVHYCFFNNSVLIYFLFLLMTFQKRVSQQVQQKQSNFDSFHINLYFHLIQIFEFFRMKSWKKKLWWNNAKIPLMIYQKFGSIISTM